MISALLIATCVIGAVVGLFLGGPTSANDARRAADTLHGHACGGTWRQVSVRSADGTTLPVTAATKSYLTFDRIKPGRFVVDDQVHTRTFAYRLSGAARADAQRVGPTARTGGTAPRGRDVRGRDEAVLGSITDSRPGGLSCTARRLQLDASGSGQLVYVRRAAG